jgi:hypothetical protein
MQLGQRRGTIRTSGSRLRNGRMEDGGRNWKMDGRRKELAQKSDDSWAWVVCVQTLVFIASQLINELHKAEHLLRS